jgi:hypothetical protein
VGVHHEFFRGGGRSSTNLVDGRGQRELRSGGCSPLVRGSTQFANEWNPYYWVVTDLFSTDLGIWLSLGISGGGLNPQTPPSVRHCLRPPPFVHLCPDISY